jgi:hypothetical protein
MVSVLSNDSDVDLDTLTITGVVDPSHGSLSYDSTHITYTPAAGYTGNDSFGYSITDGNGGVADGVVTVTVRPPGADPGFSLKFDGVSDVVTLPSSPLTCDAIFGDRARWWGITRGPYNGQDRIWVWNWDNNLDAVGIPYTPGQWVHIALVHTGGVLYAYKNGVLVGSVVSGTTGQPYPPASPILHIGGIINAPSTNWTFEGEIDEVRIWSVARTAQQLVENMSVPLTGGEANLVAYYSMSNGSGTTLTDDTGHGWNGTLRDGMQGVPADGPIQWVTSGAFTP